MADNSNQKTGGAQASDDDVLLDEDVLLGLKPAEEAPGAASPASTGTVVGNTGIAAQQNTATGQAATPQTAGTTAIPQTKAQLQTAASKFNIPMVVKQKYPSLIPLILQTESMDDDEREYWFQILPIMTTMQVKQLRDILVSEREQLKKLDEEYEQELASINDKHITEWQEFEVKQKKEELEKKEVATEEQEAEEEENLLNKLQNL